jgi:hypothetical protein
MRTWRICLCRHGQQAEVETATFHRLGCHHEATLRADIGSTLAVISDRAITIDASPREQHFFESVADLPVEARPVTRQKASARRLTQTQNDLARKALSRPISLKPLTIKPEQSVFRSRPQKARPILKEDFNRQVGETFFSPVLVKTILLAPDRRGKSQAEDDNCERGARHGTALRHIQ